MRITERRLREVIRSVIVESNGDYDDPDYVDPDSLSAWEELSQREDADDEARREYEAKLLRDFCRYMGIPCDNNEISEYVYHQAFAGDDKHIPHDKEGNPLNPGEDHIGPQVFDTGEFDEEFHG